MVTTIGLTKPFKSPAAASHEPKKEPDKVVKPVKKPGRKPKKGDQ